MRHTLARRLDRSSWSLATASLELASSRRVEVEVASMEIPRSDPRSPAVVALHCSGSSYKQWTALGAALAEVPELASRLVAPNLFGSGRTATWPAGRPQTLDDQARLVEACLADPETPPFLVGHSHGGSVALRYAATHEAAGLVLFEPNAFFLLEAAAASGEDTALDALAFVHGLRRAAEADARDEWGRTFWDFWFAQSPADRWDALPPDRRAKLVDPTLPHTYHEVTSLLLARDTSTPRDFLALQALASRAHLLLSPLPGLGARPFLHQLAALFRRLQCAVHTAPDGGHLAPITHAAPVASLIAGSLLAISRQQEER